jgi:hypothetical protein
MPPLRVDEDGSLIPRQPVEWLVCFVPPIQPQWWHWTVRSKWKHCFAMKRESSTWTLFEPWWSRMMLAHLTREEAALFLEWASTGTVLSVREAIPGRSMQLRGWMTCSALVAHLLGRKYWAWTPKHLYRRLIREPGVRIISPDMVRAWKEEADHELG